MTKPEVIELQEYKPRLFSREELPGRAGALLWQRYRNQVAVEFPSPKTAGQWQLTAQGWVGHLPLTEDLSLALRPKVPVQNIFRMLEYAYGLKSFRFLEGLTGYASLQDVYERLAHVLARRVLDRSRKGLYRAYVGRSERLPYVRERLDVGLHVRMPWKVSPHCHYHEHTVDVEENQILAYALRVLSRSDLRRPDVRGAVRQAVRCLQGSVTAPPVTAAQCVGRRYTRLFDDYQPMHALCRFFLEHSGPALASGQHDMLPFLLDMAHLYESFVAAWLVSHQPEGLCFRPQERYDFTSGTYFSIDLVLYEEAPDGTVGRARCVLDTKYKAPERPSTGDIAQVVAYAVAKGCRQAVLVYPTPLPHPFDEQIGDIRVRSLTFHTGGDLEEAGQRFREQLAS